MKSNLIKQIVYEMRHQPVIGLVTVVGTALAIFLIMVVAMMQEVKTAPFPPESNRDRMLYVKNFDVSTLEGGSEYSTGGISWDVVHELYDTLPGIERISFVAAYVNRADVGVTGNVPFNVDLREVDDEFWNIMDHTFVSGHPFDKASFDAGLKVAVINSTVARNLFGTTEAEGREMLLEQIPYKVVGVIEDVTPLATLAYGEVFIPVREDTKRQTWGSREGTRFGGPIHAIPLLEKGADPQAAREEVKRRVDRFNDRIKEFGIMAGYRGTPFDFEAAHMAFDNSAEPDIAGERRQRLLIYLILLLIPAINLSSMTQSRLRRRVGEIGVRRAFGSTRANIIKDIVTENFVVTVIGGVLGLILSLIFMYLLADVLFIPDKLLSNPPRLNASILFRWATFGYALFFCFILNLISSGIPAWRAARINPVNAINGHTK